MGDLARVRLVHAQVVRTWIQTLDEMGTSLDGSAADRLNPLLSTLKAKLEADQSWLDACTSAASVAFLKVPRPATDRPAHEIEAKVLAAVLTAADRVFSRAHIVSAKGEGQHLPDDAEAWTLADLAAFAEALRIWFSRKAWCARCGRAEVAMGDRLPDGMADESDIPF